MRLPPEPSFAAASVALNLGRMMTVVVNDEHAIHFALRLEPAARAGEAVQALRRSFQTALPIQIQPRSRRARCKRCAHPARAAIISPITSVPRQTVKRRSEITVVTDAVRRNVSLRAQAVSHAPAFEQGNDRLHVRIVETQNRRTIERHLVHETREAGHARRPCRGSSPCARDRCW